MNNYRIDTFKMDNGTWKAAAYECGRFIGEVTDKNEAQAIVAVSHLIATDIWRKLGVDL